MVAALWRHLSFHMPSIWPVLPETGEPGGLPSMGSHRVGHDWSDLAAAAADSLVPCNKPLRTLALQRRKLSLRGGGGGRGAEEPALGITAGSPLGAQATLSLCAMLISTFWLPKRNLKLICVFVDHDCRTLFIFWTGLGWGCVFLCWFWCFSS